VFTNTIAALWQRLRPKCHAPAEKRGQASLMTLLTRY
jgi:hypothetical protein